MEAIGRIQRYVGRKRRAGFLGNALLQARSRGYAPVKRRR
jgi:hypothetical protein